MGGWSLRTSKAGSNCCRTMSGLGLRVVACWLQNRGTEPRSCTTDDHSGCPVLQSTPETKVKREHDVISRVRNQLPCKVLQVKVGAIRVPRVTENDLRQHATSQCPVTPSHHDIPASTICHVTTSFATKPGVLMPHPTVAESKLDPLPATATQSTRATTQIYLRLHAAPCSLFVKL
jgi:hypothetical protein